MLKGYKTLILNGAVFLLPLLDTLLNNGDTVAGVAGPAALSLLGLANLVLRWVTTTPIFEAK